MASYGKYRHTTIKGEKDTDWYVEIHKKDFSGSSTEMTLSGEGFEITWNGQGSTRERIFLGSECVISMFVENDTDETFIYDVLDSGFKDYFVRIYKGSPSTPSNIWWFGYIQPSFNTVENISYPYIVKITCTDSFGYYKKLDFSTFASEEEKQRNYRISRLYLDFLRIMDLAPVNLVVNSTFANARNWKILENDTISSGEFRIRGDLTSGTRKPLSTEGDVLVTGNNYFAKVNCNTYTSGTLTLVDGGSGDDIGTITSSGVHTFTWTQSDASGGNGFHLYTTDFDGVLTEVIVYSTEDFPHPTKLVTDNELDFLSVAIDWNIGTDYNFQTDPGSRYYLCKGAFADNDNFPLEYNEYKAFDEALKIFNVVGFLAEGTYNFIQPNKYINNTTASNKFCSYDSTTAVATFDSPTTNLVTIDQSTNVLLGGSTFTYEAPFKSVSANYVSLKSPFNIAENTSISDDGTDDSFVYAGQLIQDQTYNLDWFSVATEINPKTNLNLGSSNKTYPGINSVHHFLQVRASYAGTEKYLVVNADNELEWTSTQSEIIFSRGFQRTPGETVGVAGTFSSKFNEDTRVGPLVASRGLNNAKNQAGNPIFLYPAILEALDTTGDVEAVGHLKFNVDLPPLDNTSTIHVKAFSTFDYKKTINRVALEDVTLTNPPTTKTHKVASVVVQVQEATSLSINEARYTEYNTSTTATENYKMKDVIIGQTLFAPEVAITDADNIPITTDFQRGNDTAGKEQLTQLLVKEFLELQQSPLQILQGDIQSANISPLDIIKYSINDDTNFEYYMFLGGKFKAKSEIMEGEWFRIKGD